LFEALSERATEALTRDDWRSIGYTLASLHQVHDPQFGLDHVNGFFGPLAQDNRAVTANRWADFTPSGDSLHYSDLMSTPGTFHWPLQSTSSISSDDCRRSVAQNRHRPYSTATLNKTTSSVPTPARLS